MTSGDVEDVLRGLTLKVYHFMLKRDGAVGVREVQRSLNMSTPSLAAYHLTKLEDAGLVKKERGDYVVDRVILRGFIRFRRLLIPRYFFYSVFLVSALLLELLVFRPEALTGGYVFSTAVTLAAALFFCYETARTWMRGGL